VDTIISKTLSIDDAHLTFLKFDLAGRGLDAQLSAALSVCDRAVGLDTIARQTFFLSPDVYPDELTAALDRAYGRPLPVTSFVYQPPAEGHAVSCEMWSFATLSPMKRAAHVSWVETGAATWGFVGGTGAVLGRAGNHSVQSMLSDAQRDLCPAGLEFGQMVRTWYYIGNLLGAAGNGNRYELFNASRNAVYRNQWPNLCLTPASTGIGMSKGEIVFEGLFIKPHQDAVQISWLDNPLQTPPYLYDIRVEQSRKPSFSRAAEVRIGNTTLTFISGTASIRASRVVHPQRVTAQTEATIENMAALIDGETLRDLQQIRVYIKRPEDLNLVRDCCRAHLPDTPCVYLIADVCKPDCLVEIEGVHGCVRATAGPALGSAATDSNHRPQTAGCV